MLWALGIVVAAFWIVPRAGAAFADGVPVPVGYDSFYHARRILDAVGQLGAFYEFDPRIHAPEGSWITWPWAYDWVLAALLTGVRGVWPAANPMAVLVLVPVLALVANLALLLRIAARCGVGTLAAAIVVAGYVGAPLVIFAHGVGVIDHHWAEGSAVLVAMLTGLRWFDRPASARDAAIHGAALGLAHGIHNGLLVLQLPTLAALALAWVWQRSPPSGAVAAWAAGLLAGLLLVLLPSAPFQAGFSAFYLLSWFHLYAACAGVLVVCVAIRTRPDVRSAALVAALAIALAIPLALQVRHGLRFIEGGIPFLENIVEAYSFTELVDRRGWGGFLATHSFLPFALPLMLAGAWALVKARVLAGLLLSCFLIMGFMMFSQQLRMWYFALPAMLVAFALGLQYIAGAMRLRRRALFAALCAVLAAGLVWPAVPTLRARYELGADPYYALVRPLLRDLATACAGRPGIALADRHVGHFVTYETDCAVIANNFIITDQHVAKIRQSLDLFAATPEALLAATPPIRYVILLAPEWALADLRSGRAIDPARETRPLFRALLFGPARADGYRLIGQQVATRGDERMALARLWAVDDGTAVEPALER